MKIENIKELGVYAYNEDCGQTAIIEVIKVYEKEEKVEVCTYKSPNTAATTIIPSEAILPIPITENVLRALSFEETVGQLYGLLDEHYFCLKLDNGIVEMIKDRGIMKYVQPSTDRKNIYGCKFVPLPYLHQLQNMIGRIDVKSFINNLSKEKEDATSTT